MQLWLNLQAKFPGLLVTSLIALSAAFLGEHYQTPTLLLALLLGLATNFLYETPKIQPGVDWSSTHLLRLGVALLGARISFDAFSHFGLQTVLFLALAVLLSLLSGRFLASRFGLDPALGILTGGGVGICGASATAAIAAVSPKSSCSDRSVSVTIIGITVLSALAMVLYPILGHWLGMSERQLGFFLGAAIHDVAQVVGAGYSVSEQAGEDATLVKLIRVAMLAPIVMLLGLFYRRTASAGVSSKFGVPAFLWGFIALMTLNSLGYIPATVAQALRLLSSGCLIMAIGAIGAKTQPAKLRGVGQPLLLLISVETLFLGLLTAGYALVFLG